MPGCHADLWIPCAVVQPIRIRNELNTSNKKGQERKEIWGK